MAIKYFRCDYKKFQSESCYGVCIPLTRGRHAVIDSDDYELLGSYRWSSTKTGYAFRTKKRILEGNTWAIFMHRIIAKTPEGMFTDHINGITSDNRKSNLRVCSHAENMKNMKPHCDSKTSKYKGVSFRKGTRRKPWTAHIRANGKSISIGHYFTEIEAAFAYNEAAIKYYGQFAQINLIST